MGSLFFILATIGAVILVSALLSGFIEKSQIPQVAVFLGIGALIGTPVLNLASFGLDSPVLQGVAIIGLVLVLFTDAMTLDLKEVCKHVSLAGIILGPGTLIVVVATVALAMWLLGLPLALAAILAAALSSTDPILLRGLLRRPDLPRAARQALRLETGLNDVILLPVVIVSMSILAQEHADYWLLGVRLLILGPAAGALVAYLAISALEFMRKNVGVRRDYESLYSLGVAFMAYAAAEAVHGSGFLAAFAAGFTIASLDVDLCDCFLEYGETTAEMLLLFTFVLLGTSLIWTGLSSITMPLIIFTVLALAARPLTLALALLPTKTDRRSIGVIAWFGPRGLSTLLLVLVPVFEGIPGAKGLFPIAAFVVIVSIVLHGGSIMAFGRGKSEPKRKITPLPVLDSPALSPLGSFRLKPTEVQELMDRGEKVRLLDVRSINDYNGSDDVLQGSVRIDPQQARRRAAELAIPKDAWAALYCWCPAEETSEKVAEELRRAGWTRAFAVVGGWEAMVADGFALTRKTE